MILLPIVAAAPAAVFAPAPGQPYIYRIEQTRTIAGERHRYVLTRRLVFRPAPGGGWIADLILVSAGGDGDAEAATFGRMAAALGPNPIRFRLDAAGGITAIDDAPVIWTALVRAVADGGPAQQGRNVAAAKRLADFPPSLRQDFLSSMLSNAIGVEDLSRTPSTRTIAVAGGAPGAPGLRLPGQEITSRAADGMIDISSDAAGRMPGPSGGTIRLTERRRVDPATGLVVERRETRQVTIGAKLATIATVTTVVRPGN